MTEMRKDLGVVIPIGDTAAPVLDRRRPQPQPSLLYRYRMFLLFVILPTLLTAAYYFLLATDQYQSEARFVVRSSQAQATAGILDQVLKTTSASAAQNEQFSVGDYLLSHDAVEALQAQMDL